MAEKLELVLKLELISVLVTYFLLLTPGGVGYGQLSDVNNTVNTAKKCIRTSLVEQGLVYNYHMLQESVCK
ncbi:Hypothetical protein CINCED_3A014753 [Cinara cedri]|uniref:Uncharacterized protein n=1 Tax=Cinara cedri TaxID=506608 RepID=A0A5E4M3W0_9HEMI|nr:Hypothetical protein CINCED_3A014753 [Cinara cedri]